MSRRDELIALAELAESGSGVDRNLDVAILTHPAIGYRDVFGDGRTFDRGNDGYWSLDDEDCCGALPSPTSSIDAAMALVPSGYVWTVATWWCEGDGRPPYYADCGDRGRLEADEDTPIHEGRADTPARALTAAALRALAEECGE